MINWQMTCKVLQERMVYGKHSVTVKLKNDVGNNYYSLNRLFLICWEYMVVQIESICKAPTPVAGHIVNRSSGDGSYCF